MALTIIKTGSTISTEKLVVQVTSDDPAVTSVIMNVRLVTGVDAHTLEHQPIFGSTNVFQFEVNSILKDYFNFEFQALTGAGTTVIENVISRLLFNEVISGVIQGVDYTTSAIIQNITQDVFEIEDFSFADYDCGTLGTTASKFLTSAPNPLVMGDNTSNFLSVLETSYTGTIGSLTPDQEWVKLDFDSLGALVNTTLTPVSVPVRSIDGAQLIGVYDIDTLRIDMDTSTGIVESRVYIRDILTPFTLRSETRIYKVNDACEKSITLSWYNELGTQDTYTLLGNITRSGKYTDSTFKRVRPVNPLSTNVGDLVYKSSYNYEYDLFSDRMPENAVQWLSNILINKRAAIQIGAIPIAYSGTVTPEQLPSPIIGLPSIIPYGITLDAGNGFMYVVPFVETNILKIDISTGAITSFGAFAASTPKWFSAELAPNGKIYCVPYYDDDVLVIDPSNDTTATLAIPTSLGVFEKWSISAITTGGVIYCFPRGASVTSILKIDTNTDTVTEFGTVPGKYFSCGLSSNGFIYAFGNPGDAYLKLNPATDAISAFGTQTEASSTQRVYEKSGIMYIFGGVNIVKLDTSNDSITTVSNASVGLASGWFDAILAQDGNFYFPPSSNDSLIKYDPVLNVATTLFVIEPAPSWNRIGISNTGIMYAIPTITNEVLKLTLGQTAGTGKIGKYFPIVIDTDKTVLEDKFAPETLFRLKFRLANERKGLK